MKFLDIKLLLKLLSFTQPYKYIFIGTILISMIFGLLSIVRPVLIQHAFDNYILQYDALGLLRIVAIIFILLLLEAFLQFIFVYRSNYLAQKIIKNLRTIIFNQIMTFKVKYFDTTSTGKIITRLVSDMEAISAMFSQGLIVIFGDIFKMVLIIICMFFVNYRLALISLAFLPFLIFSTILFQKYMRQAFFDVRYYISKLNVFIYEHLSGINIVQIFSKEQEVLDKFKSLNSLHQKAHVKTVLYFSIFLPIVDVFSAIAMGLLVWYGSVNAIRYGDVTVGEIIAFILFINMLFRPLRGIADRFNVLQMGFVAAGRVMELMDEFIEKENNNIAYQCNTKIPSGSIIFKDVNFSYLSGEPVLKNITFRINKNETWAIIGPTGSGKTTIINLLMRWYDIGEGSIHISNMNICNIDIQDLRRNIGVVLQDHFFLADTLMNNIKFFNNVSNQTVFDAVSKIGLSDFINKFPDNYNYHVGERGVGLSEGEKQLVSFLRTYLLNPSYLILDEATSSMDPLTENLLQRAIKNITLDRTSIIIAHRLSTIKYADKILVLDKGKIVEMGGHEELLKIKGHYANYYSQQFIHA